jgi:YidC/Oxa1 family membrane protein insertase
LDNQRNLLLAVLLCGLLLVGWDMAIRFFYPNADQPVTAAAREDAPSDRAAARLDGDAGLAASGVGIEREVDLATELAGSARVPVQAPRLTGSVNPLGAQIDDITLTNFRQDVDEDSGPIRWFAPEGTPIEQFARFGWLVNGALATDGETRWRASGGPLTPDSPVTLRHSDADGREYAIRISVDDQFMFTVTQTVANTSQNAFVAQPYGLVARTSATASSDIWNAHSGPISGSSEAVDYDLDYDDLAEAGQASLAERPEWLGFTDIYWLSALVRDTDADAEATFRALSPSMFRADLIYEPVTLPPGETLTRTTRVFAGAKESVVLDAYQDAGIGHFGKAIDWGWFEWFEKPMLWLLRQFNELAGNFGVAIILLTLLIRIVLFPVAQKQFHSMAGMKALQPKMKALQERYKDDKQKLQQEMLGLYKKEGVNPMAGCLPILIQIPIFFALYKVLILSIEMRHEGFLWVYDLSAPDPAMILNLFGLLPFTPPSFLGIGILAVLLGVTMWLTFKLNPPALDPMQQQIFNLMPWVLMFVMAPFAAGLLVYWVTNNILTLAQQSYLYSKNPELKAAMAAERAEKAREAERKKAEQAEKPEKA